MNTNYQPQIDPGILNMPGDGTFHDYANQGNQYGGLPVQTMPQPSERRMIAVDVGEFIRTRDAVSLQ